MDTHYARRSDGVLVKAKAGIDKHLSFFCPGCKREMYAATEGKKQRAHFRHKSLNGNTTCSDPESYIHWVTKELFAEQYPNLEAFHLSIDTEKRCVHDTSCIQEGIYNINLKEKYPYIKVEEYDNGFRPDCLLYNNNGDKLYLEAHYTNGVTQAKIESGMPIIEVKVYDPDNIDDILKKGGFTTKKNQSFFSKQKYYSVEVYNMETLIPKEASFFDCKKSCLMKTAPSIPQPTRRGVGQKGYIPPSKRLPPNHPMLQGDLPYGITNQNKPLPNQNEGAIKYLSQATGKRDNYSTKTAMPHVLAQAIEAYTKNIKKYKENHVTNGALIVLVNESTFQFIECGGMFFGALRYEAKWHIFTLSEQEKGSKISFIESVSEHNEVNNTIRQCTSLF